MTGLLPAFGAVTGFVIGLLIFGFIRVPSEVSSSYAPYLSLATLAALDTTLGGIRAGIDGLFQDDVFVTGFVLNTMLAAGLAFLGDKIGVDLFLAAVVALGTRVFLNLSLIRRHYLIRASERKRKLREQRDA
ncbi:MAG: small basic family protein [Chthonomonadales bacterium]